MSLKLMNPEIPFWKKILRKNFTSFEKLIQFLEISKENQKRIYFNPKFILNLPYRLAEKIEKNNLDDPIFKQFVPTIDETNIHPDFTLDPVQDCSFQKEKKLLNKYSSRALFLVTGACAMHCRYCFRQNFPYETSSSNLDREIDYIKNNPNLIEIILSGGDPLSLSDEALSNIFQKIDPIDHVQRIRIHTRFPIGIPERITSSFLELLKTSSKQIFFSIHCNHPKELDDEILESLKKIQKLGIPILNQSVLLKGVNDDAEILLSLSEILVNHGILPYYLHLLDPVQGASHFEIDLNSGINLIEELKTKTSGYAVPKLAREEPGKPSKTFI